MWKGVAKLAGSGKTFSTTQPTCGLNTNEPLETAHDRASSWHDFCSDKSLSWDEKSTWKHTDFYIFFVSDSRFDGEMHVTAVPTRDIVWMPLRRGVEEPIIGSAQVNMPLAPAASHHGRCR